MSQLALTRFYFLLSTFREKKNGVGFESEPGVSNLIPV